MILRKSKISKFAVGLGIVAAAVVAVPTAAQAAVQVTSCPRTQEVCRDTQANFTASTASIKTITQTTSTGTAKWSINKGTTGASICSGTMGYNDTRSCNLGGYTGQLTATFYKGQNSLTTVSLR